MLKKLLRILQWFVISVSLIIFVFIGYTYYQFNYYSPQDDAKLDERNLGFFSNGYTESRTNFRKRAEVLQIKQPSAIYNQFFVPSEIDNDLSVDYIFIPATQDSSNLIILSSGVHGVEAYAGSAIQQMFMEEFINEKLLKNTGVLLIHSINPFGFKYSRRVSENNVDLNRNSYVKDDLYHTKNDGYPNVSELINPSIPLKLSSFFHRFFYIIAVNEIRKKSMPVLRQAVLQGQYEFPKGMYYGGQKQEPQIDSLKPILKEVCQAYENILAFDLHTGYGERGKMHLFPNPVDEELKLEMEELFEGYQIDWGDTDDFYTVTGDFVNFIGQICRPNKLIPMTLEFGTMDSQTTLGSIKSLQIGVAENQGFHFGYESDFDKQEINKLYLEMYNPSSFIWKSQCIEQSRDIFKDVLPKFTHLK